MYPSGAGNAIHTGRNIPSEVRPVGGVIDRELIAINEKIHGAHQRFDVLVERLTNGIRPEPANGQTAGKTDPPPVSIASPHGETLRACNMGMDALIARVNELIDRVDV